MKKDQVKRDLLYRLNSGEYSLAGRIPAERDLSKRFQVSRMTVRAAIDELVSEGVLSRHGRHGTLICRIPAIKPADEFSRKQILFVYFSSFREHPIDQFGASSRIYRGIECFANQNGYGLMVQSGENFLCRSSCSSFSGIIAGGSELEKRLPLIMANGVPVVTVDFVSYRYGLDAVCCDHYGAGVKAGQIVLDRQYRRVLLLICRYEGEDFIQPSFRSTLRGFMDSTESSSVTTFQHIVEARDVASHGTSVKSIQNLLKKEKIEVIIDCSEILTSYADILHKLPPLPAIVTTGNDNIVNCPQPIDVLSFDDQRVGFLAAKRLVAKMENPLLEPLRFLVPVKELKANPDNC